MQNIKAIINNHNMNILHQNNEIKDEYNCRNKKHCPLGGKCLPSNIVYQGKITSTQPNYNDKVYFGVAEKSFKDSTTAPNPLPMKIMQMTQNYRKNTGKLKGATIPKVTRSTVRECPPYSLNKRKWYLCLNYLHTLHLHLTIC